MKECFNLLILIYSSYGDQPEYEKERGNIGECLNEFGEDLSCLKGKKVCFGDMTSSSISLSHTYSLYGNRVDYSKIRDSHLHFAVLPIQCELIPATIEQCTLQPKEANELVKYISLNHQQYVCEILDIALKTVQLLSPFFSIAERFRDLTLRILRSVLSHTASRTAKVAFEVFPILIHLYISETNFTQDERLCECLSLCLFIEFRATHSISRAERTIFSIISLFAASSQAEAVIMALDITHYKAYQSKVDSSSQQNNNSNIKQDFTHPIVGEVNEDELTVTQNDWQSFNQIEVNNELTYGFKLTMNENIEQKKVQSKDSNLYLKQDNKEDTLREVLWKLIRCTERIKDPRCVDYSTALVYLAASSHRRQEIGYIMIERLELMKKFGIIDQQDEFEEKDNDAGYEEHNQKGNMKRFFYFNPDSIIANASKRTEELNDQSYDRERQRDKVYTNYIMKQRCKQYINLNKFSKQFIVILPQRLALLCQNDSLLFRGPFYALRIHKRIKTVTSSATLNQLLNSFPVELKSTSPDQAANENIQSPESLTSSPTVSQIASGVKSYNSSLASEDIHQNHIENNTQAKQDDVITQISIHKHYIHSRLFRLASIKQISPEEIAEILSAISDLFADARNWTRSLWSNGACLSVVGSNLDIFSERTIAILCKKAEYLSQRLDITSHVWIPTSYYYIKLQGDGFPADIRGTEYIYTTKIGESFEQFIQRIQHTFSGSTIITPSQKLAPIDLGRLIQVMDAYPASEYQSYRVESNRKNNQLTDEQIQQQQIQFNKDMQSEHSSFFFYCRMDEEDEFDYIKKETKKIVDSCTQVVAGTESKLDNLFKLDPIVYRIVVSTKSPLPGHADRVQVQKKFKIPTYCDEANIDYLTLLYRRFTTIMSIAQKSSSILAASECPVNLDFFLPLSYSSAGITLSSKQSPSTSVQNNSSDQTTNLTRLLLWSVEDTMKLFNTETAAVGLTRANRLCFSARIRNKQLSDFIDNIRARVLIYQNGIREQQGLPKLDINEIQSLPMPDTGKYWVQLDDFICSFIEKRLGKDGGIGKKIEKFRSLTMGIENYIVMRETASDK
ncbi:MAG: hypothetical protein EZS28_005161 [Streblomastix strix]|uniref:Uncharacterized protein n=1 Tax=Streblomastix strix TaxID=222440 RepID=A0A5J4WWB4_9EUKA|nr:MAG: hypothetical protein EZS28_005161 [Streblomastix strix]